MPNRLQHESSPYLLQHAKNPVDWYPWGEEALSLAVRLDKPLLVSIGYGACHWCHVMEYESFENKTIAALMNANFVCVKVDREERPDLDRIYQVAHQMLTDRAGGWPLTLALTPRGHAPFFAGTYFPPSPRQGMPGFAEILEQISQHYEKNKGDMHSHEESFRRALSSLNPSPADRTADPDTSLDSAIESLKTRFDPVNGGFGDAPKFPHPCQLELLLRHSASEFDNAEVSRAMFNKSVRKMCLGGMFDQLGGGFFRYSVDKQWQIPHFEKMLYDNAQLLSLCSDGYCIEQNPIYRDASVQTIKWLIDDVQLASGGYASTLDADSEGVEGKFYVWSETDLRAILSEPEYDAIESRFGLFGEPNFEGKWHFNVNQDEETAKYAADNPEHLQSGIEKLQQQRDIRIHPNLDDKILTGWNGLMIKGMAKAGCRFGLKSPVDSAQRALDFIRTDLWQQNRLFATWREGQAKFNGYLDDYAFLAEGIIELLQARWRSSDLELLTEICNSMLEWFEDSESGGFYFTSHDHEKLLQRQKPGADDATPSANGVAASVLWRLGLLLMEPRYTDTAQNTLKLFSKEISRNPSVLASLNLALQDTSRRSRVVIVRGAEKEMTVWQNELNQHYMPDHSIFCIPENAARLPAALSEKAAVKGKVCAYICQAFSCLPPITDLEELKVELAIVPD